MKITLCGSSAFREKKVEIMDQLIEMGHEPIIHHHYIQAVKEGRRDIMNTIDKGEHAELKIKYDYIRWYYKAIKGSEAVLIINLEKNKIKNYIGGNTFLEIGFAYTQDKKIFLLNNIPVIHYRDEIIAMKPIIINNDLNKIK